MYYEEEYTQLVQGYQSTLPGVEQPAPQLVDKEGNVLKNIPKNPVGFIWPK